MTQETPDENDETNSTIIIITPVPPTKPKDKPQDPPPEED